MNEVSEKQLEANLQAVSGAIQELQNLIHQLDVEDITKKNSPTVKEKPAK